MNSRFCIFLTLKFADCKIYISGHCNLILCFTDLFLQKIAPFYRKFHIKFGEGHKNKIISLMLFRNKSDFRISGKKHLKTKESKFPMEIKNRSVKQNQVTVVL